MSILRINLFGGIEVLTTTGEPVLIASRKASTLFGFLTLICPHGASRGKLSSLFWDGQHEDHARASLRQTLLALRRALSHHPAVFVADREDIRICSNLVETDVQEFEQLLVDVDPTRLMRAAELYRGDLFDGAAHISFAFDAWVTALRQRIQRHAIKAMEASLIQNEQRREWTESATLLALRILAIDPLQEEVHRILMRCYFQSGRRAEALRQYEYCRTVLWNEVRVAPEPETERLQREIRANFLSRSMLLNSAGK
jgi:DNA-binding SARP family transcriptional activator